MDTAVRKTCKGCGDTKTLDLFAKEIRNKDGRSGKCYDCSNLYYRERGNLPDVKRQKEDYRKNNKSRSAAYNKEYYSKNRDSIIESVCLWQSENKDKTRLYKSKNKAARKGNVISLTPEQESAISDFYWLAKDLEAITGEPYHVDHIIPLQGKNVCGLHVIWNLQYLTPEENLRKGNKV